MSGIRPSAAVGIVALILVALPASAEAQAPAPDAAALFKKYCTQCHLESGAPTKTGEMLKSPHLATAEVAAVADDTMAKVIAEGRGKMKGLKEKLTEAEIRALVGFVKAIPKKEEPKP